jgi:hypothetical protein
MQITNDRPSDHPLKNLTPAQFMALGGNAVVYLRHIGGDRLGQLLPDLEAEADEEYHIAVGADGSPLMVADTEEALAEWLQSRNLGVVTVH